MQSTISEPARRLKAVVAAQPQLDVKSSVFTQEYEKHPFCHIRAVWYISSDIRERSFCPSTGGSSNPRILSSSIDLSWGR